MSWLNNYGNHEMKRFRALSAGQQDEVLWLFQGMPELKDVLEDRADAIKLIRLGKTEYELADEIFGNQGASALQNHCREAGNDSFRHRICYQFAIDKKLDGLIPLLSSSSKFGYDKANDRYLAIFRLAEGRGNPGWLRKQVTPGMAKQRAHDLIDKIGAKRYRLLRNHRGKSIAPQSLLDDVAQSFRDEEMDISASTVRERLKEAGFRLPVDCIHYLR